MQLGGRVAHPAVECGGQGGRGVDDEDVAPLEQPGQVGETPVLDDEPPPAGHQEAHGVTGQSPLLGRSVGFQLGG